VSVGEEELAAISSTLPRETRLRTKTKLPFHGSVLLRWTLGVLLISGALLAGEMSGHTFFADKWYGFDDAPYSAVRLLGILGRASESLADMRRALPQVLNTPELRFNCAEDRKFEVVREVQARLATEGARACGC
jgi:phosphomannomutase